MALDEAYFNSINIDVAKKKYYNVNKVEAVLADIRREAAAMNEENARLRREVERMTSEKLSVGDALISAKELAQRIVSDANAQAEDIVRAAEEKREQIIADTEDVRKIIADTEDVRKIIAGANERAEEIIRDAEKRREEIISEARKQEDYAAQYVQGTFERLKEQQLEAVRRLNADYQEFLCGLYGYEEREGEPKADAVPENAEAAEELLELEDVPADLGEKVGAIAQALRDICGE